VSPADGKGRRAAIEILLNTQMVSELIFKGEFHEIKPIMEKSRELGMRTFDWALFELYNEGFISYEEAIRNADSANQLRINIKLKSQRGEPKSAVASATSTLSFDNSSAEEMDARRKEELEQQKINKWMMEKKLAAQKLQLQGDNN